MSRFSLPSSALLQAFLVLVLVVIPVVGSLGGENKLSQVWPNLM